MIARVRQAVVLGAGTMGAQLACLLAGAGARVTLLDIDTATAAKGLERAIKTKPSPLYRSIDAERIETGSLDELPSAVRSADWVLEAIVEQPEPKRALLAGVDESLSGRADWPLVSTNTSGLSIHSLTDGRSDAFRRVFMGTHFFNPPRYARLLELIPTETTDPTFVEWIEDFASRHLGKGTVVAKDTPAFIANRLGVHGLMTALALAQEFGLGVDEVDELTGPLLGRPKSATFRTLDIVGLDVAVAVAEHCFADLADDPDRERFRVPAVLQRLIERKTLGEKTGAGFYKRDGSEILALDLETLDYRPRRRLQSPSVEMARTQPDLRSRFRELLSGNDTGAKFLWQLASSNLVYTANVAQQIADTAASVDRAMRWGFGWELGPFETWDALGPAAVAQRLEAEGRSVPELATAVIAGPGCFYGNGTGIETKAVGFAARDYVAIPSRPGAIDLTARRRSGPELPGNASAALVDLGNRILGLELHGKLNIIGVDTLNLLVKGVELAAQRYDGLVVGTLAADFSAGANLALMLIEAEDGEWDELDRAVRRFQAATSAIRYSVVPVVVAPRGRTLGGGAEFCLAAARCQPLSETYIGLVETGVGLLPAGGGTTAMARRAAERIADGAQADLFAFFRHALETIGFARVSTSGEEGRALGLFSPADLITVDPDRQWSDAARVAGTLAEIGYRPPGNRPIQVVGRRGIAAAETLSYNQLLGHQLSEHDRRVVLELATVMSGGDVAEGTAVSEAYLLDLEREAFLRLLGEPKTRDRIRHTLKTGKPLRN